MPGCGHPPLLKFYVTLSCDFSQSGVGEAILQNDITKAYASQTRNPTQQRYAQIEKEFLAIQFRCQKFDDFLFGHTITVETDHEPLEMIFCKPLRACSIRLKKMLLKLQCYDLTVRYKRGAEMYIEDTLSMSYLDEIYEKPQDPFEVPHIAIEQFSSEAISRLQTAIASDPQLKIMISLIECGWPEKQDVHPDVCMFHRFRDQLSMTILFIMPA